MQNKSDYFLIILKNEIRKKNFSSKLAKQLDFEFVDSKNISILAYRKGRASGLLDFLIAINLLIIFVIHVRGNLARARERRGCVIEFLI